MTTPNILQRFQNIIPNEMNYEFIPIIGANAYSVYNSAARKQMNRAHASQHLVTRNIRPDSFTTGLDMNLAKTTFAVKMPMSGTVVKIIHRYPVDEYRMIPVCPETFVIFQTDSGMYEGFSLPRYFSSHQYFGFMYAPTENINLLCPGVHIPKGTVFLETPAVNNQRRYGYGCDMNVATMTVPEVSDDGIVGCFESLQSMGFDIIERVTVSLKPGDIPLDIYSEPGMPYKAMPGIGDKVKPSGLLFAARNSAIANSPATMTAKALRRVDYFSDNLTYLSEGGGTVIDIKVLTNTQNLDFLPEGFLKQCEFYESKHSFYYDELISYFHTLKRRYGENVPLGNILSREMKEAMLIKATRENRVARDYHGSPVGEFRIEFTVQKELRLNLQFKATNNHGGKGVLVDIWPRSRMPVDANGNRADWIVDPISSINRMCMGAVYEPREKEAARDFLHAIRRELTGNQWFQPRFNYRECVEDLFHDNNQKFQALKARMRLFYSIIQSDDMSLYDAYTDQDWINNIVSVIAHDGIVGFTIFKDVNRQALGINTIIDLDQHFPSQATQVSFIDHLGNTHVSVSKIPIAPMYMLVLEKIAKSDWTATSSSRYNTLGVIGKNTKQIKRGSPGHDSSNRSHGEAEMRVEDAFTHPMTIAEINDRNGSPRIHRMCTMNILTAEYPTRIEQLIDRNVVPYGSSSQLSILDHMIAVYGQKISYVDNSKGYLKAFYQGAI